MADDVESVPLSALNPGEEGRIAAIDSRDAIGRRLLDLGLVPETKNLAGAPRSARRSRSVRALRLSTVSSQNRGGARSGDTESARKPDLYPFFVRRMSEAIVARPLRLGLIGSPNAGKTTLFNALTGLRARVGNYAGVTVDIREGHTAFGGRDAIVVDLPGTYSLDAISDDERLVTDMLAGQHPTAPPPDALILVADACSLRRSLMLIGQVLQHAIPACLVLTMTDELSARGGQLDIPRLEAALGIPVCGIVGHRGKGIDQVRTLLGQPENWSHPAIDPPTEPQERALWVESILEHTLHETPKRHRVTDAIDRVLLNPYGAA